MTQAPPEAYRSLLEQGYEQLRAGLFEKAIDSFKACLLILPGQADAFRGRAFSHFRLQHWKDAQEDFEQARKGDPENEDIWIGLGMSLFLNHKIYEGIAIFDEWLAKKPSARAHIQLAQIYFKIALTAKGREHMEKALANEPTMEERRVIETTLSEQDKLDKGRYYRPDFEALRKQNGG